eukprot:gene4402-5151_t
MRSIGERETLVFTDQSTSRICETITDFPLFQALFEWLGPDSYMKQDCLDSACRAGSLDIVKLLLHTASSRDRVFDPRLFGPLIESASGNHRDILEFLLSTAGTQLDGNVLAKMVTMTIKNSHLAMAERILALGNVSLSFASTMELACQSGSLRIAQLVHKNRCQFQGNTTPHAIKLLEKSLASTQQDMALVEWILKEYGDAPNLDWMGVACRHGNLVALEWIRLKRPNAPLPSCPSILTSISNGHISVLKWLIRHHPDICCHPPVPLLVHTEGHLAITRYMHETLSIPCSPTAFCNAITWDRVEVAECMVNLSPMTRPTLSPTSALSLNYIPNARISGILLKAGHPLDTRLALFAVFNNDLATLEQIGRSVQQPKYVITNQVVRLACQFGRLAHLKYMLQDLQIQPGCDDLVCLAAANGELSTLQYLCQRKHHYDVYRTICSAVESGSVQVLSYLLYHLGHIDCLSSNSVPPTKPLEVAISLGHLSMIKYLFNILPRECWTLSLMDVGFKCGQLSILKFLWENIGYKAQSTSFNLNHSTTTTNITNTTTTPTAAVPPSI